uniref:(northern house mosquito) hypothetical protein n=1 Tax=Culex pipiens TaxID=7175 RepID=A0A8D8A409_CULPI
MHTNQGGFETADASCWICPLVAFLLFQNFLSPPHPPLRNGTPDKRRSRSGLATAAGPDNCPASTETTRSSKSNHLCTTGRSSFRNLQVLKTPSSAPFPQLSRNEIGN